MRCPNCNVEVPDNTKFCMNCGSPLPQDQTQNIRSQETQRIQGNDPFEPTQRIDQPQAAQESTQDAGQQYQQAQTQQIPQEQPQYQQGQTQQMPPQGQYQQAPAQGIQQPSIAPFVLSIVALVFAILGAFPVSLILAIIALVMNSKQKKRGEFSTKQTPTFVMSIISLVLSVIMAIVTIVLGGAIWLALVNGEFNTKSYSSSYSISKSSSSSSSKSGSTSKSSSSSSSSASSKSSSSSSSSASSSSSTSYSTYATSTISDFTWVTSGDKGKAPAGAKTLTQFGDIAGGWKAYMYGSSPERLLNITIGGTSGSILMDLDWDTVYDSSTGQAFADDSDESLFKGALAGSALEATGSGKVTLTNFWEANGRQYATGTFMWPSGEVQNLALVRP